MPLESKAEGRKANWFMASCLEPDRGYEAICNVPVWV